MTSLPKTHKPKLSNTRPISVHSLRVSAPMVFSSSPAQVATSSLCVISGLYST
ncbi:Uncharacterised protein [Shigella sonnei]|nr:Uncharacterised protein [Shigella sonnei]